MSSSTINTRGTYAINRFYHQIESGSLNLKCLLSGPEQGGVSILAFFGLEVAFDTTDPDTLLSKPRGLGAEMSDGESGEELIQTYTTSM